jgi:hypothetical protein
MTARLLADHLRASSPPPLPHAAGMVGTALPAEPLPA